MKSTLTTLLLLMATLCSQAQGIEFQKKSFEEVRELARKENKLIFIDFYTVWCVPCKVLDREVFSQKQVGDVFNKQFISYKLDAEKEGKTLAQKFNINAYPTLVFINNETEVVNKVVGSIKAEKLLTEANKALDMKNNSSSYSDLKRDYPKYRNDERFLKNYIARMIEFSESPIEPIEDYLKVQKTIKEKSADMMEFFLENANHMICGGKAEEILLHNYSEYLDIATKREAKKLEDMPAKLIQNTYRRAMGTKDVALYEVFMDRWLKLPKKPYYADYNAYKLELIGLKKDDKLYKMTAEKYLDSLTTKRTVKDIHDVDSIRYAAYEKANPGNLGMFGNAAKLAQKDLDAHILINNLNKVLEKYLVLASAKADYKKMKTWIKYGMALLPDDAVLANLEVSMLLKQGNQKEAIQAKERLVDRMDPKDKKYTAFKAELETMKKNIK